MQSWKEKLDEIESVEGHGTQLVSLYIPEGKSLGSVINRLQSEHAEAENIKSKSTRKNVQRAVKMAINSLRMNNESNGIVIFAGVDKDGNKHEWNVSNLEVESFIYHCDSEFETEPLREILDDSETFGLVVVERRAATIGKLKGETIVHVRDIDSDAPGKHSAGGFSQQRFERIEEETTENFYETVAQAADDAFDDIDGLFVGGSNISKDQFTDHLSSTLERELINTYPVEYHGETGLKELVNKASDQIDDLVEMEARNAVEEFFNRLPDDRVTYGRKPTKRAVEMGAVDTLLVGSEKSHPEIPDLIEQTENMGGEVIRIPESFEKGQQFSGPFDGIGALLRYDVS